MPFGLFGKARLGVLGVLFSEPNESFYLRELARKGHLALRSVQRELSTLERAGLIRKIKRHGKQAFYQAEPASPIYEEIRSIIAKIYGPPSLIAAKLSAFRSRIFFAAIFGSYARGSHDTRSDIDVLIVGDVSFREIVSVLHDLQKEIGREINPTIYTARSFQAKLGAGDVFLAEVLRGPWIVLIGDERELRTMARKRLAGETRDQ